jgi:glutamine amidotransferase
MITIVDYGLGNITAFLNVYKRINIQAKTATTGEDLRDASKVILPGVGHFDHAMRRLNESGMRDALDLLALEKHVPVLGVCVGMQMMAHSSEEGVMPGLGWINGRVRAFSGSEIMGDLPLPHMGWNDVRTTNRSQLFDGLESEARFYFLHSFFFECFSPDNTIAVSSYGSDFSSAVWSDNIYGVQFHPEKSHRFGTQLLNNFAQL